MISRLLWLKAEIAKVQASCHNRDQDADMLRRKQQYLLLLIKERNALFIAGTPIYRTSPIPWSTKPAGPPKGDQIA